MLKKIFFSSYVQDGIKDEKTAKVSGSSVENLLSCSVSMYQLVNQYLIIYFYGKSHFDFSVAPKFHSSKV